MAGLMLISSWGTQSLVSHLPQATDTHPKFSFKQVYVDIYNALQNPSFAALFWGSLTFTVTYGIVSALSMHLLTFFWEVDASGIEYTQYGGVAGGLIGIVIAPLMNRWLDKKMTLTIGIVLFAFVITLPVMFKLTGAIETHSPLVLPMLVGVSVLTFISMILAAVSAASMMADIADEHEFVHGKRQEGVYFGSHSFGMKATGAFEPGEVPEEVLFNFGLLYPGMIFLIIFALWIFWPYSMDKDKHAEILAELEARHQAERV